MKFKPGDRIVYAYGKKIVHGTVINIDPQLLFVPDGKKLGPPVAPRFQENLELEQIYESPLYQALR